MSSSEDHQNQDGRWESFTSEVKANPGAYGCLAAITLPPLLAALLYGLVWLNDHSSLPRHVPAENFYASGEQIGEELNDVFTDLPHGDFAGAGLVHSPYCLGDGYLVLDTGGYDSGNFDLDAEQRFDYEDEAALDEVVKEITQRMEDQGWTAEEATPAPSEEERWNFSTTTDRRISLTVELRHRLNDADRPRPLPDATEDDIDNHVLYTRMSGEDYCLRYDEDDADPKDYDFNIPAIEPTEEPNP